MTPARLSSRLNWLRRRLAEIDPERDIADPAAARLIDTVRLELDSLCRDLDEARND